MDFSEEPPLHGAAAEMLAAAAGVRGPHNKPKSHVSAALAKMVFWYYCEGGDRSKVGACVRAPFVCLGF